MSRVAVLMVIEAGDRRRRDREDEEHQWAAMPATMNSTT
jgi:hypothetical protein